MNDKKQEDNVVPVVDNASVEKDLISSEDVLAVVSGDQVALAEQMERAKEAALSQKGNAQEIALEKAKKKLEEEEKKKKAVMEEVKRRKEEAQRREQLAREEAERKRALAEAERQRQLAEKKRIEEENKLKEEKEKLEIEHKKQEKEAAIKAREDAKKAKIQARIDAKNARIEAKEAAKNARIEAKEAAKKAKIEARENAKKAKEEAKKSKIEAKKAKEQARVDAKKAREQAKKDAKNKKVKAVTPVVPQKAVTSVTSSSVSNTSESPIKPQPAPVSPTPSVAPVSTPIVSKTNDIKDENKTISPNAKSAPNNNNNKQKKESNFKYYMTFIFLALLILMVIFLPDISSFVSNYFASKNQETIPEITTGTLTCVMNTNDDKYDYYYEAKFNFKDSKMYRLTFSTTTKGDQRLDAIELSTMESSCNLLRQQTESLEGIDVSCSLSNGVYKNIQKLNYESIDEEKVTTAYLEAGGTYPNYKYEQDISDIEKEMKASNYTCERHN